MKLKTETPALVFFDIDGTLLDENYEIPASAAAAIRMLRQNGHLAFLNTGRCPCCILPFIHDVGFDGVVASCGTHVTCQGETLLNVTVPQALLDELLPVFDAARVDAWLEGPDHVYYNERARFRADRLIVRHFRGFEHIFRDWHDGPVVINKLSYRIPPDESLDFCRHLVEPAFQVIRHSPQNGEMVPKGYSKATGMQRLLDHLGLPRSRTYAFGDSLNDLDMLSFAEHAIAMGGSRSHVLAVSDHVTATPADDGIARGLRHCGLI